MIKFSIITVCYNERKNIENCVNSVFSQTYKNIQYIVIDGASTDGTKEYLDTIANQFSYYKSEKDSGIYNAMNKALYQVDGDIIYFLNASDYFFNDSTLNEVAIAFQNHKEIDVLHGNLAYSKAKEELYFRDNKYFQFNNLNDLFINNLAQQCFFIKNEVFVKIGKFNESYKISADYEFILKAFKANYKFLYIPIIFCVFDMNGISATQIKERLKEKRSLILKYSPVAVLIKYFIRGAIQHFQKTFKKEK